MDHILESAAGVSPTEDEINQVIATSRRRERHRGSRREPLLEDIATAHPEDALTARNELAAIRRKVGDRNWALLTAVGIGSEYKEISIAVSSPPGAVRVKGLRLRASLPPRPDRFAGGPRCDRRPPTDHRRGLATASAGGHEPWRLPYAPNVIAAGTWGHTAPSFPVYFPRADPPLGRKRDTIFQG